MARWLRKAAYSEMKARFWRWRICGTEPSKPKTHRPLSHIFAPTMVYVDFDGTLRRGISS